MDADLSHDPKDVFKLLTHLYDLVIGSRYIDGVSVVNWPIETYAQLWSKFIFKDYHRDAN